MVSQKDTFFFLYVHFFLFVQKETNQRKRAPEMITSAFFGKMPQASRSQKSLKFAPFPVCHRTFLSKLLLIIDVKCWKKGVCLPLPGTSGCVTWGMQINNRTKVVFKDYSPNQMLLLPPSLEEMIDPNHPVRIVNQVIDNPDLDLLIKNIKVGGYSSYHPRLLLRLSV